jgi:energy-coupling factor transport system substrate-specific component
VVVAVISVAFGVFFWAFGSLWAALNVLGPLQNVLYAVWLLPAIVAPLVVRRPGAAIFAELVAATLSALLGSQWGITTLTSGLIQGLGAELGFAAFRYRRFDRVPVVLASVLSMAGAFFHDWLVWYPALALDAIAAIGAAMAVSGIAVLPVLAIALVRALRSAGVAQGSVR